MDRRASSQFLTAISSIEPRNTRKEFTAICKAWVEFAGADWAWLWMRNPISERFELASRYPEAAELPQSELSPDTKSASEYCLRTRRPLRIDNVETWSAKIGNETYRVHYRDDLLLLGNRSYDTIPFLSSSSKPADAADDPVGVITLHYLDRDLPEWQHGDDLLEIFGRLCWNLIASCQRAELLNLLVRLNEVSAEHLGKTGQPTLVRSSYLTSMIDVIKERTNCLGVSIYYQEPGDGDTVTCVGTTGLVNQRDLTPVKEPSRIKYRRKQTRIGQCFAEGTVKMFSGPDLQEEVIEAGSEGQSKIPSLYAPIKDVGDETRCVGVVKCIGHKPLMFKKEGRGFDPFELRSLTFINDQLSRDLETLAAKILREKIVKSVKHDLRSCLLAIRNAASRLSSFEGMDPRSLQLTKYLNASSLLALTWLGHLDYPDLQDPAAQVPLANLQDIHLRKDVVSEVVNFLDYYAKIEKDMSVVDYTAGDLEIVVPGERELLTRALSNVVLNAINYGSKESEIEVELRLDGGDAVIEVRNQGVPILDRYRDLIFDAYYRTPEAKKHRQIAHGMGLWIVRNALERHGGSIELVEIEPRTVFALRIPVKTLREPNGEAHAREE